MKIPSCLCGMILMILSICACSTTTPTGCRPGETWYRPDTTPEETRHDLALCQYDALSNRRTTSVYGDTVGQTILLKMVADSSENSKENQLIAAGMAAKGYTLIKRNSPPPKSSETENRTQQPKVSVGTEAKLIGRWESVSFKTKIADKDQGAIDKQVFTFFSNQRLLTETIYRDGKVEPRLNHYNIVDDRLEIIDPSVAKPYRKTASKFSLIEDQMILTTDNLQMILHKILDANPIPESENLLLGPWICDVRTNEIVSQIKLTIMPHNHYNFQIAITSPQKHSDENEDGIYCYDAEQFAIVFWSNKESEPQWFKCYVTGNKMNLVKGKVTLEFSREE